jgi:sialate O-acetylesterase
MLSLSSLFTDHAVIQCEHPINLTGHAIPGSLIAVAFTCKSLKTTADSEGDRQLTWPSLPSGGPYVLNISSGSETLICDDMWLGEVWLCSGQSNMEWTLAMLEAHGEDIDNINDPQLLVFTVQKQASDEPLEALDITWKTATSKNVRDFSASAYFFGRQLRKELGKPVGLIVSAYGGSSIGAWLPRELLQSRPEFDFLAKEQHQSTAKNFVRHRFQERTAIANDWYTSNFDDHLWEKIPVPGFWQDYGWQHNGAVWYRKAIEIPPSWRGRALFLEFGSCDDFDDTFVNGIRAGGMGAESPNAYTTRRVYPIPGGLTDCSTLTVAVRVFDHWGNGGIIGRANLLCPESPESAIDLSSRWAPKPEINLDWRAPVSNVAPAVLFNGMIAPLHKYPIRGILWYQGESDVTRAAMYRMLLPALITSWREQWKSPLLPFGIVQLANYGKRRYSPVESDWAELREAQALSTSSVTRTGLVVASDLGESDNVHSSRKAPLGKRLALWALSEVYEKPNDPWLSPRAVDFWFVLNTAFIRFNHVGAELRLSDLDKAAFQLAGQYQVWHWVEATVTQNDMLSIKSKNVQEPVAVRYAWQDNPPTALRNSAGLPVVPFRSDNWALTTRR